MGLCLSGGGYRAMLFHAGAVWRLGETGLLQKLRRVSSVSGGSITAGVLGMRWKELGFDGDGVPRNLGGAVVDPIRRLASRTLDVRGHRDRYGLVWLHRGPRRRAVEEAPLRRRHPAGPTHRRRGSALRHQRDERPDR